MTHRLDDSKKYKLFVNGAFPRSESGRTTLVSTPKGEPIAHVAKASRKYLREAVEAARGALAGGLTAEPWAVAAALQPQGTRLPAQVGRASQYLHRLTILPAESRVKYTALGLA
jgi:acyl-CoA reductase-like NAD-dependent aldehyde dehydrogenase